ncbi:MULTISPECIES: hypothetical protein [unclassified Variovorax]|uniref:hypothetical protein n=1 Tax=unclassified Variovorax TaxID=663243 RepID=UPI001317B03D|nr:MULTISPECIES: hypothetical protein [unclassified Variovorax]VTU42133.1 hypothetical protein SRS16P1_00199 [Variovorax sp. SRS16]VTU42165.1 hypothetical protein E5P1_00197 [Variovorax sp. PBL-E5]VTU44336.1 hypothetical protein H6P1_00734 [Variovorax sp. PBL-H6]
MNQNPPNLAESNFLQIWEAIRDDAFSKRTADLLGALNGLKGAGPEAMLSRLLCYIYDIAVYQLGAVYGDLLPSDANAQHFFVATPMGFPGSTELIPSTRTEDESYVLAAKHLALMDRYLSDYAQRPAL